jgi:hypothetical protein
MGSPNYIVGYPKIGHDEHGPAYPEPDGRDQARFDMLRATYEPEPDVLPNSAKVIVFVAVVLACLFWLFTTPAPAMDHGFDPNSKTVQWFERLMRPDMPDSSCCGKGDGYPVERYWQNKDANGTPTGTWTAVIGDGSAKLYPDGTTREYIATGTEVIVPDLYVNNYEDDLDNPTDVSWIFMAVHAGEISAVYCLVRHPSAN